MSASVPSSIGCCCVCIDFIVVVVVDMGSILHGEDIPLYLKVVHDDVDLPGMVISEVDHSRTRLFSLFYL